MATAQSSTLLRHLRRLTRPVALTDRELLERFTTLRDETAFAALVGRHGALVLDVCRRVLRREQDAEDAFQAAFLVLARKAASIRKGESLASWLYGVAWRCAVRLRSDLAKRRRYERRVDAPALQEPPDPSWREVQETLHEELARLPEKYQAPLVLCYLEGRTQCEAARQLGWGEDVLRGRIDRGRERLRQRLVRRGVTLSAALLAAAVCQSAAVSAALVAATARLASGAARPPGAVLANVIGRGLIASRLKIAALMLVTAAVSVFGYRLAAVGELATDDPKAASAPPVAEAQRPRTDFYGDPLPEGAVARLGSVRFYHGNEVDRVVLSGDGKWIVSRGSKGGNRLWDARTGKEATLAEDLRKADFFAAADKLVAVKREARRAVLWDVIADKEVGQVSWPVGNFHDVALSPDGKTLVTGGGAAAGNLVFGDTAKGTVRQATGVKADKGIWKLASSADSSALAIMYSDNSVDVWNVKTRTVILSVTPKRKSEWLGQLALSADGNTLAVTGFNEDQIRFWDVREKQELTPLVTKPSRTTRAVSFAPDGRFLVTTHDAEVRLWDFAARKEVRRLQGKGGPSGISCPVFSKDGKRLVAADQNDVSMWDLATSEPCHDFGHIYAIDGIAFAPDGKTIASGAAYSDTIVRTWEPLTGRIKGRWRGHTSGIEVVAWSPDGKLVASGSQDRTVRLWDTATGKEVGCLDAHDGMIYAMAFSPDGKMLASGGNRKVVHLWDVANRKEISAWDNPGGWTLRLAFSPDGKALATRGFEEGLVRIWDVATGTELRQLPDVKAGCPKLSFAPDNRTLAVNCDDGTVRLFDVTTGREVRSLGDTLQPGQANRCLAVAFAPDGRSLAAGYDDKTTRVWEVVSGRERARFAGHTGVPLGLAYSPDGSLLASGGSDHVAFVWDVQGRHTLPRPRGDFVGAESDRLWTALADEDARAAYRAFQTLLAAGKPTAAFLRERLQPVAAVDQRRITRLAADLDNDQFAVREEATKQLRKLGDLAEPALRAVLAEKPSPELRRRAEGLLAQVDASRSPTQMRAVRAVELLEYMGGPEARQVLQKIADGPPEARLTREAKVALERLGRR